jgi:hypothetical protein
MIQPQIVPRLRVLDEDNYPYPRYWIKRNRLRPSVSVLIENCPFSDNNLTVLVVPMDPETRQPLVNAKLEGGSAGVDEALTSELKMRYNLPAVRFAEMKIMGDRNLGGRHGNDIQLAFCLYSKHAYPPQLLSNFYVDQKIKIFNRFDELPGTLSQTPYNSSSNCFPSLP